ncbi:hypothetical protein NKG94_38350 [Micromonospora sp. M12]
MTRGRGAPVRGDADRTAGTLTELGAARVGREPPTGRRRTCSRWRRRWLLPRTRAARPGLPLAGGLPDGRRAVAGPPGRGDRGAGPGDGAMGGMRQ